jgi:hypothetical protein
MNVKLTLKMTGMIFSKLKLFIVDLLMMGLAGAPLGFTIYRRFVNPSKTPRSLFENTTEDQGLLYLWLFTIFLVLWIYYCWRLWFYREKDVNIAELDFLNGSSRYYDSILTKALTSFIM